MYSTNEHTLERKSYHEIYSLEGGVNKHYHLPECHATQSGR